jgi:hypothetical protein
MGRPKDAAGKPDGSKLKVNVDMYYTGKDGKPVVFDVGTVTVTYTRSLPQRNTPTNPSSK